LDTLSGGGGAADTLLGGKGDDTYVVDAADTVTENASEGTDTVQSAVSWTLGTNVERLLLTGSAAVNGTGNAEANSLTGNSAANRLLGLDGLDTLSGGGGADTLAGGKGNDTLTGGEGADVFVFDSALSATSNRDVITDFSPGSDKIRLGNDVFTALGTGALAASRFAAGPGLKTAGDADDRILYDTSTGSLYYDPDGTGSKAAVLFAVLGSGSPPALTAADFVIVD
ncbi:MAG: M10 family metallopeptidase C-terminal domain-containing protein, partial [Gammaproteobacteria bacterium]